MRNSLGPIDKINEIRLLFDHPLYTDKVIFLVEGGSDLRLLRDIYPEDKVKISDVNGKKTLLPVMETLFAEFPEKILGICDADNEHLMETAAPKRDFGVFMTDYHDSEIMIINSPALNSFISEYSNENILTTLRENLLNTALESAYVIGLLRWANIELNLNINFKKLSLQPFTTVDQTHITVELDKLFDTLIQRSDTLNSDVNSEYLRQIVTEYGDRGACRLQVCCGHDVTNIISLIYRQSQVSLDTNMSNQKVESSLRLAYQDHYFRETELYSSILEHMEGLNILPIAD
ncbi:hypothetical protein [Microbulbifer epialgicus]|uniref:DUF4435 domain-containing protein n=1 Tax=Microbulbifer epialgicus TaxID=393907 RepID=A0ABV4P0J6_9GAMM